MAIEYPSASIPASTPIATAVDTVSRILAVDTIASHKLLVSSVVLLISLLILEQAVYRSKKGHLPGAHWKIPIIGKFLDSMNPTIENYQKQWDLGPLSVVSVFHMFIVMASSNEYTRKILNSPAYAEPCLVNAAPDIIERDNWVFLNGKVHADYRRGLNALFTRKAIGIYLGIQDKIMRKHFAAWLANTNPNHEDIMGTIRDLNMETSLRVFCGTHIPAPAVKEITEQYWLITKALELVNFPLNLPGTNVYNAIQARKVAMKHLEDAAKLSKLTMTAGAEPQCLIDEWVSEMMKVPSDGKNKTFFSDHEMAQVVFSFLFASQDAMSSGTIYLFQHLADMPDILAKVREEHDRIRPDVSQPLTLEDLDGMPYLRAVVKESMRVKPPVTMVPYRVTKDFPIADNYTVPAGAMVIPSIYPSTQDPDVYPQPKKLIPERWLDPDSPANQNPKHYLIFGSGPHRCIGQEYAILQMSNVIVTAAALMDWDHKITPESEKVRIIATLFPKDGCLLKFRSRSSAATA